MYHSSTQKAHWSFHSVDEISGMWDAVAASFAASFAVPSESASALLSGAEGGAFCRLVGETGLKFCRSFTPPMPSAVIWTAFTYFHRFYLRHSPIHHGPRNVIMGCLYLACKVEEFNISADDFVKNLRNGSAESNLDIILSHEPLLMRKLDYELTVHSPFRPLEGLLISLKTHAAAAGEEGDPEALRGGCSAFLETALLGPATLLFPPSQIALAALRHSAAAADRSLDAFLDGVVLAHYPDGRAPLLARLDEIADVVQAQVPGDPVKLRERVTECAKIIEKQKMTQPEDGNTRESIDSDDD